MGRMTGIEPATTGITIRGSTNWATSAAKLLQMARPTGLEPVAYGLEGLRPYSMQSIDIQV